jgi:hypothetical protein
LLGLQPADEPICPRDFHDRIRLNAPPQSKDQAWRFLVRQIADHGGNWHLYAIGAMVPGLTGIVLQLAPPRTPRDLIEQAYREVIGQFLVAIEDLAASPVQLAWPNVAARLLGRALYHATTRTRYDRRHEQFDENDDHQALTQRRSGQRPPGHPDFVLEAMVEHTKNLPDRYQLTGEDAELSARSRMEYVGLGPNTRRKTIADAATELGIAVPAAGMRRWRAEVLIARLTHAHARGYHVPAAASSPPPHHHRAA